MKAGDVVQNINDEEFIGVIVEFWTQLGFTVALVLLKETPIKKYGLYYPCDLKKLM